MRTENMQAYMDNLARRIDVHGKGMNSEDQRMRNMIQAVEDPECFICTDNQSIEHWKEFAREQIEYGREAVAEIKRKAPDLYAEVDKEGVSIGYICKVIEGGWEYGGRFMRLLQGLEAEVQ